MLRETETERQKQREIVGRVIYLYTVLHNNVFDLYFRWPMNSTGEISSGKIKPGPL